MSGRLAVALVERIRQLDAFAKFVLIEAVSESLALAVSAVWEDGDDRLPTLAIACANPSQFGRHGLVSASVATLRNESPRGVCVVVCEGTELAERQSINNFVPVSPADLLEDKSRLMLLADAVRPVRRDGPVAAVREAIVTLPTGLRPSASSVAAYFDLLADGQDALAQLPVLGGFRDSAAIADVRGERIKDNLLLAASRRSDEVVKPGLYPDIRGRAERVLVRGEALLR